VGVIGIIHDITDWKKADDALRESEGTFKALAENANDGILVAVTEEAHTYANRRVCEMLGYSVTELQKSSIKDLVVPDEAATLIERFRKRLLGEDIPQQYVTSLLHKDGKNVPVEISAAKTSWHGQPADLVIIHDITERKRAEKTIRHALAEREVLLREIHHRVKNNLASIISLIGLQVASLSDPTTIFMLRDLETRIQSMALVHESLYLSEDLARINFGNYTEKLTRHLFDIYVTGAKIRCRIEMGDVTMPIETAIPCGLVMTEIITNSLKYAFPKTFSCKEIRGKSCSITLTLRREDSNYLLNIADNGIGIPERTDVTVTRTLGLYLIKLIVQHQLRGTLDISTDRGTSYTIRFPEPAVKGWEDR
jgi:PAS domain S-box-containing protein